MSSTESPPPSHVGRSSPPNAAALGARERVFHSLGRWINRHPYYPIAVWVVILILAIPALSLLGNVTTNSATVLPSSAPSIVASHELARLFPNSSTPSTSLIVLEGNDITGPLGHRSVEALTKAITDNGSLQYLASVTTLYTAYASYLGGQTDLALGILAPALSGNGSLYAEVNGTASLVWYPPAAFAQEWGTLRATSPPTTNVNGTAFTDTNMSLGTIANGTVRLVEQELLAVFYQGFNASSPCEAAFLASPAQFGSCVDTVARSSITPLVNQTPELPSVLATPVLSGLGIGNFTSVPPVRNVTVSILSPQVGLGSPWLREVLGQFPGGLASPREVTGWVNGIVNDSGIRAYPLPIPGSLYGSFVDPGNNLSLMVLSFSVDDSYVAAGGATPVFSEISSIGKTIPSVLATTDPSHALTYWQTGQAALDLNENDVLSTGLALTLPLSIAVLLIITGLYFRSPLTPAVAFGPIGMALLIGMGGTYAIGSLITKVDVTTLTLQDAFVLGVGTDYAVFLLSRYREELRKGATPDDAVVTMVTWAGESIAISGLTVILSTVALAFSGVALLSQWGLVLSLSVLIALLVAITMVPAILTLAGPRVFWPDPRRVPARHPAAPGGAERSGYFAKASRFSVRRAVPVVLAAVILSIPLGAVALTAPVTFDFYSQLPANQAASHGLAAIANHFGPGHAFPIEILVTFQAPLVAGNTTDVQEFEEVSYLTGTLNRTHGVASVDSPTGIYGVPLGMWLSYGSLPVAERVNLGAMLSTYVGNDQRTVLFTVVPTVSGLSGGAIDTLNSIESNLTAYHPGHATLNAVAYGGAASELRDLNEETNLALDKMIAIVVVGLMVVLLALLASMAIPLLAIATIGMSIAWAWALTYMVMTLLFATPIFFFDRVVLFVIVLGLGMDYNIFILTRIREERSRTDSTRKAIVTAVTYTGGVVTAAALILASVFFVLASSSFALLATIGFSLGVAVVLDAMVVRTYVMPALLSLLGERVWWVPWRRKVNSQDVNEGKP